MFSIKNKTQMIVAALAVMVMALAAMMIHVQINYEPDFRSIVRLRAAIATSVVSFPLTLVVMYQVFKTQQLSNELQRLLDRDRLTDVSTRDFFFSRMAVEPDAYGVVLMIDIDHFKQVNDGYGHLAGDAVIANVAGVLRGEARKEDIVCRFGGEEFVVFLHQATPQDGWQIAERSRCRVAGLCTGVDGGAIEVTVSVGASLMECTEDIEDAIRRADNCLYRAKASGRNCTVTDWGQSLPREIAETV